MAMIDNMWRLNIVALAMVWSMMICRASADAKWLHQLLPPNEYIPVERLHPGMRGYCKSTFNGTQVSTFPITIIGILKGVDFGMDLILIRIDGGPVVSKGWGVVSGMSGSPVYIDGKLIGAISYGWAFSRAPIAGVTPIKAMIESALHGPKNAIAEMPQTIRLKPITGSIALFGRRINSVRLSMRLYDEDVARARPDEMLLIRIATPVMVHGMPKASLERLRKLLEPYALVPMPSPGRPSNASKIMAPLEPGSAVGAQLTSGDIELTVIGTLTYRRGNIVLAFGHPFLLCGETSMPLTTAYVYGILPSQYMSVKLASPLKAVGAFTQDRAFAVAGTLGLRPKMIQLGIEVVDRSRAVERRFDVSVFRHRMLTVPLIDLLLSLAFSNITSEDEHGTVLVSYEIHADGLPTIRRRNAFVEGRLGLLQMLLGYSMSSTSEIIQMLLTLQENKFGRANVNRVIVRLENLGERHEAFIERIECDKRAARPKDELTLTIHMRKVHSGWEKKEVKLRLPDVKHRCTLRIGVAGGSDALRLRSRLGILQRCPNSLPQLVEELIERERNDQIVVCLQMPSMGAWVNGKVIQSAPFIILEGMNALGDEMFHVGSDAIFKRIDVGCVVQGMKVLSIKVEPQYPKEVPQPSPELEKSRMRQAENAFGIFEQLSQLLGIQGEVVAEQKGIIFGLLSMLRSKGILPLQQGDGGVEEAQLTEEGEEVNEEEMGSSGAERKPEEGTTQPTLERFMKARRVEFKSQKDFMNGECDGTFVASDGSIRLGLAVDEVASAGDSGIWRVASSDDGAIYACSWLSGKVYEFSNGVRRVICSFIGDGGLSCVPTALLPFGDELLIGTSPDGEVYSVGVKGEGGKMPKVWLNLDCKHIWTMGTLPSGDVIIGTGAPGRVFQISKDGRSKLLLETHDEHVMALAVDAGGVVYAGTYPGGKLWCIFPDGTYRAIWETRKGAISALHVTNDGSVYVGITPQGEILRLSHSGNAKLLYDTPSRHIIAIHSLNDGKIVASGIMPHAIYLIDTDGAHGQALKLSNEYAAQIDKLNDGLLCAMSTSGRIVKLTGANRGEYISPPIVLPTQAEWRILKCSIDGSSGEVVSVEARSGNSEAPDDTWSEWEQAGLSEDGFMIKSPPARALQWRIRLERTDDRQPVLYGAVVCFAPINVPPSVQFVSPTAGAILAKTVTVEWKAHDPNSDELEFELYCSGDGGKTWHRLRSAKSKVQKDESAEKAKNADLSGGACSGESKDGAEDIRPKPQKGETGITVEAPPMPEISEEFVEEVTSDKGAHEEKWQAQKFEWDTTQLPDGRYVLKVVASDVLSNPLNAMRCEAISPSFIVDNTPPVIVSPKPASSEVIAIARLQRMLVRDKVTWVARAEFKVDDEDWRPLMCADGSFDSGEEEIFIPVDRLPSGKHSLKVRIYDAAGNSVIAQYLYTKGED